MVEGGGKVEEGGVPSHLGGDDKQYQSSELPSLRMNEGVQLRTTKTVHIDDGSDEGARLKKGPPADGTDKAMGLIDSWRFGEAGRACVGYDGAGDEESGLVVARALDLRSMHGATASVGTGY